MEESNSLKGYTICSPKGVNGDALRENLLEGTDTGFFECWTMFEAEGSNLQFKLVDQDSLRRRQCS